MDLEDRPLDEEHFPGVILRVRESFAHDIGDVIDMEGMKYEGVQFPEDSKYPQCAFHYWWQANHQKMSGESAMGQAKVFLHWFLAWERMQNDDAVLTADEIPSKFVCPPDVVYHPPSAKVFTLAGKQFIFISYFRRGHSGSRGQEWSLEVRACHCDSGAFLNLYNIPEEIQAEYK